MKEDKLPKQLWMEGLMKSSLTHATKSVAWVISNRAYGHKTESNPSFDLISEEANVSRKNVWRHIKEMEDAGWIAKSQKLNSIQRPYNIYKMTTPQITAEEAQPQETAQPQKTAEQPQDASSQPQSAETQPQDEGGISKEEVMEEVNEEVISWLLTQPITTYNNDLGFFDEEIPNIEPLIPLDAFARVEHSVIDNLFAEIQHSTEHIDRALVRKDYANAKKRAWGIV